MAERTGHGDAGCPVRLTVDLANGAALDRAGQAAGLILIAALGITVTQTVGGNADRLAGDPKSVPDVVVEPALGLSEGAVRPAQPLGVASLGNLTSPGDHFPLLIRLDRHATDTAALRALVDLQHLSAIDHGIGRTQLDALLHTETKEVLHGQHDGQALIDLVSELDDLQRIDVFRVPGLRDLGNRVPTDNLCRQVGGDVLHDVALPQPVAEDFDHRQPGVQGAGDDALLMPVGHEGFDVLCGQGLQLADAVSQFPQLGDHQKHELPALSTHLGGTDASALRPKPQVGVDSAMHAVDYGLRQHLVSKGLSHMPPAELE